MNLRDEELAEALKGAVIAEYERAIERGVSPAEALSVLLSFAAEETGRLSASGLEDAGSGRSSRPLRFGDCI